MLDNFSGKFDYTARVFDRTETCDLSDDYTLPDYMPAVGRVLSCTAVASQPTLYIAASGVECTGGVRYSLLYESAEDSELFCAELPGEYDVILTPERDQKTADSAADVSGICDATLENVTARVTAPRRLTVKSKLRLRPALRTDTTFETLLHGADYSSETLRKLEGKASCTSCACATAIPVICRDKISKAEAGMTPGDEVRVISAHGDVMITNIQSTETAAECRGDVNVSLLVTRTTEGERPKRIIRKIPFSTTLPFDAPLPPNARQIGIRCYGVCPSVTHTVEDDTFSLEASILLSTEIVGNAPITYLKDSYSKDAECETAYTEITLHSPVSAFNGHATLSAAQDLASLGLDSGMKLCDVTAKLHPEFEKELDSNGKLTLTGKIIVTAVADNGAELIPATFDSNFRYTADLSEAVAIDQPIISAVLTLADLKGRIDADNISCDYELCAAVTIEQKQKITVLAEANLTPASGNENEAATILICYPERGQTLWDIAKKYRTDVSAIIEKNPLPVGAPDSPDSLTSVKFLII